MNIGPFLRHHKEQRRQIPQDEPVLDERIPWEVPGELVWPDRSVDAQYDSAVSQIEKRFNHVFEVSSDELAKLRLAMMSYYRSASWRIPSLWWSDQHIRGLILDLNPRASPGWPFNVEAGTIQEYVKKVGVDVVVAQVQQRLAKFRAGGQLLWDPDHLFIKTEGHKVKKREEKAWRLIWGNSIICQILQRIVLLPSLLAEQAAGRDAPCAARGLKNGETHLLIKELLDEKGVFNCFATDCSGFDMTVNSDVIQLDCEDRRNLCENAEDGDRAGEYWALYDEVYRRTYCNSIIFGDGWVYEQQDPGIQRSGSLITFSLNSRHTARIRALQSIRQFGDFDRKRDWLWAAGDDSLCKTPRGFSLEQAMEDARAFGQVIKHCEAGGFSDVDFCSYFFFKSPSAQRYVGVPKNQIKHRFSLKIKEPGDKKNLASSLSNLMQEYAYADEAVMLKVPGYTSDFYLDLEALFQLHATDKEKSELGRTRWQSKRLWLSE